MNRRHPILAAILIGLVTSIAVLPTVAAAADKQGRFVVRGLGSRSCKEYVAAVQAGADAMHDYLVWMEGYLSAVNKLKPETFDVLPVVTIGHTATIIYGSCVKAPDMRLESVVDSVVKAFSPYRVKEDSQLIEVTVGDVYAPVRKETMMLIQRGLAEAGLYSGPVDGLFSPDLQRALLAYQDRKTIAKTGAPDAATILNLIKDMQPAR